jgi:hypothetical protein
VVAALTPTRVIGVEDTVGALTHIGSVLISMGLMLEYDKTYRRRSGSKAGPLDYYGGFFMAGNERWFSNGRAVSGDRSDDLVKEAPGLIVPGDFAAGCICVPTANSLLGGNRITSLNPDCPFHGKP